MEYALDYISISIVCFDEGIYYIKRCAEECYNVERLKKSIEEDDYHHQGIITSNFKSVLSDMSQALRAIGTFKD